MEDEEEEEEEGCAAGDTPPDGERTSEDDELEGEIEEAGVERGETGSSRDLTDFLHR